MSKTITLRISEDHYEMFKSYALKENRKISNAIETLALKQLEATQFVGKSEMEGILADKDLLGRIRRGVKQGGAKKGRFVG
jgi:predicted CopG family antitoxin